MKAQNCRWHTHRIVGSARVRISPEFIRPMETGRKGRRRMTMVQFQRAADCWLSSLGLTLLILSVVLVPTSGALGHDGVGGPLAVTCKSSNGCSAGGRKQDPITGGCPFQ